MDRRSRRRLGPVALTALAALAPLAVGPSADVLNDMVLAAAYVVMALGLNIVVGFAVLLDLGYVAFFAIGAYTAAHFASGFWANAGDGKGVAVLTGAGVAARGDPCQLPARLPARRGDDDGGGRADRRADAAPARRLHRDRDARVRRDHRAGGAQRRRHRLPRRHPDRRPERHRADRQDRPAGARAVRRRAPAALVLVRARPRRPRAHR